MLMSVKILEYVFLLVVPILVNMALLTLLERKVLSFSQLRVGPNKVGAMGSVQPVADAVKLFLKNSTQVGSSVSSIYMVSPSLALALALGVSGVLPQFTGVVAWEYMFLVVMMVFSLGVYPVLLSGWSSNSKYSMVGSARGVAQTVSYEISMAFLLLTVFMILGAYSQTLLSATLSVGSVWVLPLAGGWALTSLAELNRTPFDLSEGESELVSGFNTEYGSAKFAVIFMGEYVMIMFLSIFSGYLFFGGSTLMGMVSGVVMASSVVWARATLPRVRYDALMSVSWKSLLPLSLGGVMAVGGCGSLA